ncbi:MAG TPA: helix-turn-helix transcriptional regulator, partial [Paraburkholderia sp.]
NHEDSPVSEAGAVDIDDLLLKPPSESSAVPAIGKWNLGELTIATLSADSLHVMAPSKGAGNPTYVLFIRSGGVSIRSQPQAFEIEAPSMVMIDSERTHSLCFRACCDVVLLLVPRHCLVAKGVRAVRSGTVCADFLPLDNQVASDFLSLLAHQRGESSRELRRLQGEHLLDIVLFVFFRLRNASSHSGSAQILLEAKRYIAANLGNGQLGVRLIADACGVTTSQLQRVFSRERCSVMQYVQHRRMRLALELLTGPSDRPRTIREIASICGFPNQAYFSKAFRRYFSVAPRDATESLLIAFYGADAA